MQPSGPIWRVAQWFVSKSLGSAAKQVLSAREIALEDGQRVRWLPGEAREFLKNLPVEVTSLRSHANLNNLPNFGNRLMVELTVWTIGAYRALRSMGVTTEEARALVADIGWVVYAQMLRLYSLPFRLITRNPAKRLRWTIKALLRFPFSVSEAPGYAAKISETEEGILTHFTHCPPQSFVRRLGEEAGNQDDLLAFQQSWCRYDWAGADLIAGDGRRDHYERPHTLSHGDAVCDMCWRASTASEQSEGAR